MTSVGGPQPVASYVQGSSPVCDTLECERVLGVTPAAAHKVLEAELRFMDMRGLS